MPAEVMISGQPSADDVAPPAGAPLNSMQPQSTGLPLRVSVPENIGRLPSLPLPPMTRSGTAWASAFHTASCMVSPGPTVASAVDAGYSALQTVPLGASAVMCLRQPSL